MRFFFFASAESTDTDEGVACVNTAAVHRMQELVQVRNFNALSMYLLTSHAALPVNFGLKQSI